MALFHPTHRISCSQAKGLDSRRPWVRGIEGKKSGASSSSCFYCWLCHLLDVTTDELLNPRGSQFPYYPHYLGTRISEGTELSGSIMNGYTDEPRTVPGNRKQNLVECESQSPLTPISIPTEARNPHMLDSLSAGLAGNANRRTELSLTPNCAWGLSCPSSFLYSRESGLQHCLGTG